MNMKRMRGRSHRGGGTGGAPPPRHYNGNIPLNRNHVFDSNGPDLRVRGTAQQLFEKYLQLGRDAASVGDRVMAEGYFQHAEHYFRIVNAMNQAQGQGQGQVQGQNHYQNGQANGPANGHGQQRGRGQGDYTDMPEENDDDENQPGMGDQPEGRDIPINAGSPEN